jgi:hypothetical protein
MAVSRSAAAVRRAVVSDREHDPALVEAQAGVVHPPGRFGTTRGFGTTERRFDAGTDRGPSGLDDLGRPSIGREQDLLDLGRRLALDLPNDVGGAHPDRLATRIATTSPGSPIIRAGSWRRRRSPG